MKKLPLLAIISLFLCSHVLAGGIDRYGPTASFVAGTPGFSDTGVLLQLTSSVAGYNQSIIQNTSAANNASTSWVVSNNLATATTYFGEFGINSSTFTGSGAFNAANSTYLSSKTGDLALGTLTANAIHFVVNNGATDAITVSSAGATTIAGAATLGSTIAFPAARKGTFVCTGAGSITVANANMAATSNVIISMNAQGGTITTPPAMKSVAAGTNFIVLCGATDTSTYNYVILN